MQNNLFFISFLCLFLCSCTQSPEAENTKNESSAVNTVSSPVTTPPQPDTESKPPIDVEKKDIPHTPKPVVTKSNTSQPATIPQPSPERTNVPPAKEVALNSTEKVFESPIEPAEAIRKTATSINSESTTKPSPSNANPEPENPPSFSHQDWDDLLKNYVSSSGKVNYAGIKSDKAKLEAYLQSLQNNPPKSDWSRNKTMAFWINAYNAFTVKLIVENYPVSSITKLDGGKPWDKKWIKIGDRTYSLNAIENDILRPTYKDARIHFAVNCAAKSCPPLLNKAWTADNLNSNFEKQAKAFINNPSFNKIAEGKVQVSKIFEWYAADFGNLIDYLNKYSNTQIKPSAKIEYLEYNWDLNN